MQYTVEDALYVYIGTIHIIVIALYLCESYREPPRTCQSVVFREDIMFVSIGFVRRAFGS